MYNMKNNEVTLACFLQIGMLRLLDVAIFRINRRPRRAKGGARLALERSDVNLQHDLLLGSCLSRRITSPRAGCRCKLEFTAKLNFRFNNIHGVPAA